MKHIARIMWSVIVGLIAFTVADELAKIWISNLKGTGGLITASEIMDAQIVPYIAAILLGGGLLSFFYSKENN